MKRSRVFVIPVVLLLFMLLPGILHAEQEGISDRIVANTVTGLSGDEQKRGQQRELDQAMNESYGSRMDPLHPMVEKNPRQWYEDTCHPIRGRDGMMNIGIQNPANYALSEKRPDRERSNTANTSAVTWKIEAVDAPHFFYHPSSRTIAVDASNHPHIAYGGDHLYYAYHNGSKWNYQTVDSSPSVGEYASLALDKSGKVHISYLDHISFSNGFKGNLKYATNASGSWVTTTVDSTGNGGQFASIAVDTSGKAHISYYSSSALKYATNASGSWVTTTVDSIGNIYTSIAVDTSGKVHISYKSSNYTINYATNVSGSWVKTTVDSSPRYYGGYNSIAVDTSGKVHISYFEGDPNYDLKYATNASGSWVTTTVGSLGEYDENTSIAVDTSGNVHISYFDNIYSYPALKYATNASGSWITTTVDSIGYTGSYTSIAVDTSGKAHISCYYNTEYPNFALKYATNASGSWVTTTVDSSVAVDNSLALDTSGKVHISYFDYTNGAVKYATNVSGSWVTTTVDSSGEVGGFTSLALDTLGNVHISYYDYDNLDIKYATNALDNKPTVKTKTAAKVTDNSATLNGTVNVQGLTTRVWFQYGTTKGSYTENSSKKTVKGSTDKKVGIGVSGLTSQTKYYYRIAARNKDSTSYGDEKSFTTK